MTFVILNTDLLRSVESDPARPPLAQVSLTPSGDSYLTVVTVHVGGTELCVYSEFHAGPNVPADAAEALAAFNADPNRAWRQLVAEALDTEDQILEENLTTLGDKLAEVRRTRLRLLG